MSVRKRDQGSTESRPTGKRTPPRRGRPPKITIKEVRAIGELMALGVPEAYACELHGVNPETFGPAVSRKPEFKRAMMVHHAQFMAESLKIIKEGGEVLRTAEGADDSGKQVFKDRIVPWTGRAWILERRYKPHFNKTEVHKPGEGKNESGGLMTAEEMADLERMTKALVASLDGGKKGEGRGEKGKG